MAVCLLMDVPFGEASSRAHEIGATIGRAFKDRLRTFVIFKQQAVKNDTGDVPGAMAEARRAFTSSCETLLPHLMDEMHWRSFYSKAYGVLANDQLMFPGEQRVMALGR